MDQPFKIEIIRKYQTNSNRMKLSGVVTEIALSVGFSISIEAHFQMPSYSFDLDLLFLLNIFFVTAKIVDRLFQEWCLVVCFSFGYATLFIFQRFHLCLPPISLYLWPCGISVCLLLICRFALTKISYHFFK